MKRFAALAIVVVGAFAAVAASPAAPSATPTNFRVTFDLTFTHSDCGTFCDEYFEGTAIVPKIGPAEVTAVLNQGCHWYYELLGERVPCQRSLAHLREAAPRGGS